MQFLLLLFSRRPLPEPNREQVPWEHSSLIGSFYFKAPEASPAAKPVNAPAGAVAVELAYWDTVKDSEDPAM